MRKLLKMVKVKMFSMVAHTVKKKLQFRGVPENTSTVCLQVTGASNMVAVWLAGTFDLGCSEELFPYRWVNGCKYVVDLRCLDLLRMWFNLFFFFYCQPHFTALDYK